MNKFLFLFDLDSIVLQQEIFSVVAKEYGMEEKMNSLNEKYLRGELPFNQSFLQQMELFKKFSINDVRELIETISLNEPLAEFIKKNREKCFVLTKNPDVWIEGIVSNLGMSQNTFCTKTVVEDGYIKDIVSVVDKNAVLKDMGHSFVAVGVETHDAEMLESAEIGIGYGGVREISKAVLACASHAVYDGDKLVEFLEKLV